MSNEKKVIKSAELTQREKEHKQDMMREYSERIGELMEMASDEGFSCHFHIAMPWAVRDYEHGFENSNMGGSRISLPDFNNMSGNARDVWEITSDGEPNGKRRASYELKNMIDAACSFGILPVRQIKEVEGRDERLEYYQRAHHNIEVLSGFLEGNARELEAAVKNDTAELMGMPMEVLEKLRDLFDKFMEQHEAGETKDDETPEGFMDKLKKRFGMSDDKDDDKS